MIYLNDRLVTPTLFPDNTSQVWKVLPEDLPSHSVIRWEFSHEGELVQLAQLKALFDTLKGFTVSLYIPYLPYGRQDKPVSDSTTFALRPFATLLNAMGFQHVAILDPHSGEALSLIANSFAYYPVQQILYAFNKTESDVVCYPDGGAMARYSRLYDFPYVWADKMRDAATGQILRLSLHGGGVENERVLIVDDICDGGATFKILADKLYAAGASEVNLFVTHGIFSKGLRTLHESGIRRIFTHKGEPRQERDGAISYPTR